MTRKEFFSMFALPLLVSFLPKGISVEVTRKEGGKWERVQVAHDAFEHLFGILNANQIVFEPVMQAPCSWAPDVGWVRSVRFPDGRIWDAFFHGWRPQYPLTHVLKQGSAERQRAMQMVSKALGWTKKRSRRRK